MFNFNPAKYYAEIRGNSRKCKLSERITKGKRTKKGPSDHLVPTACHGMPHTRLCCPWLTFGCYWLTDSFTETAGCSSCCFVVVGFFWLFFFPFFLKVIAGTKQKAEFSLWEIVKWFSLMFFLQMAFEGGSTFVSLASSEFQLGQSCCWFPPPFLSVFSDR